MLKKRIIPCLDIANGKAVKGVQFCDLKDAGNPVELAQKYSDEGADELVFLDITATHEHRKTVAEFASEVAAVISIPFTIGGGIRSADDIRRVLEAGADKVALNSAALENPTILSECARIFGSQTIVLAIDAKKTSEKEEWEVYRSGGRIPTGENAVSWAKQGEELGAGEILLTSMDRDGTRQGFDIPLTSAVSNTVHIPVIASGGVGTREHFAEVFRNTSATGALAASVFHFGNMRIGEVKQYLQQQKISVRL